MRRILLVRPAVEAGEKLGFLPGDLAQKIDPYLRPLYDALYEMVGMERVDKYIERNVIEVAPLAYMRGRTLNNAFIILDESQNTTIEQMKMFLTRIGFGATAVITGDVTQIDLPGERSGLIHVLNVLKDVEGLSFTHFDSKDVVRHPVVQRIVEAYAREDARKARRAGQARRSGVNVAATRNAPMIDAPQIDVQIAASPAPSREAVIAWARAAMGSDGRNLCIRVVDETEARDLNWRFRAARAESPARRQAPVVWRPTPLPLGPRGERRLGPSAYRRRLSVPPATIRSSSFVEDFHWIISLGSGHGDESAVHRWRCFVTIGDCRHSPWVALPSVWPSPHRRLRVSSGWTEAERARGAGPWPPAETEVSAGAETGRRKRFNGVGFRELRERGSWRNLRARRQHGVGRSS